MKKSNVLIMLLLAMTLVFTACNSDDESNTNEDNGVEQNQDMDEGDGSDNKDKSEDQDSSDDQGSSRLSTAFVEAMQSEEYTMKYRTEMEIEGTTDTIETTLAMSGDDSAIETKSSSTGAHTSFIQKGDTTYMIDHSAKTVIEMPYGEDYGDFEDDDMNMDESVDLETDDMLFSTSGRGEFKGKTYDYEEYSVEGGYTRYYFDGKTLVGMEFKMGEQVFTWEVLEFSESVDDELFEIPSGYQTIDMGSGMQ